MHGGGRKGAWSTRSAYLVTAELVVATAFQPAVPVLVTWDDEYAWLPTNVSNTIPWLTVDSRRPSGGGGLPGGGWGAWFGGNGGGEGGGGEGGGEGGGGEGGGGDGGGGDGGGGDGGGWQ